MAEIAPSEELQAFWDASLSLYRRSPQFKARMKNFGAYDYWRKHGFPPQCKPVGADDFVCN